MSPARARAPTAPIAALAVAVALATLGGPAAADETPSPAAPPVSQAAIAANMTDYYGGERNTAFLFTGIGLASAGGGAFLATRDSDFPRGLGWSMIGIGGLEAIGAIFYAIQVGAEVDHYTALLEKDHAAFQKEEAAHIHGTTSRFFYYRAGELVLALAGAGIATYGFATNRDVWKGAGIGIGAEALTFFVLDAFGAGRAHAYEDRVQRFAPSLAFTLGRGARPWSFDLAARF